VTVRKRAWRVGFLVATLLLGGCRRDLRRAVQGEWQSGGARMQFYGDGQVLMQPDDSTTAIARYAFIERERMRLTELGSTGVDYQVVQRRDSLVLCRSDAPAQCYRLARVGRRR
jgi:hypothetical protein